jgi:hypothetical protein
MMKYVLKQWIGRAWFDPKHGKDKTPSYLKEFETQGDLIDAHWTTDLNEAILFEPEEAARVKKFLKDSPKDASPRFSYTVQKVAVREVVEN